MTVALKESINTKPAHDWLRNIKVAFAPAIGSPVLDSVMAGLSNRLRLHGHQIQSEPDNSTDIIFTTASFGQPVGWRDALLFTSRRRLGLDHTPTIFTLIHVTPERLQQTFDYFETVLAKEPPDPADYAFPGLAPEAYHTLVEQGRRGGPIMALERLVQAQSKSIRILLVVGGDQPMYAYLFDLAGAYPRIDADAPEFFYDDIALRIVTAVSTFEVTQHEVLSDIIARSAWDGLTAPRAMLDASHQLGKRAFFTEMVRVANLVYAPAISDAIADQYSEGCFATWEPKIDALVATITGSARPVDKTNITEDDLAVIVGVRPDGLGAVVRHVEGKRNDKPSSEAVEMKDMDGLLPTIVLGGEWGESASVQAPVARSKLHGHRGVGAYDSRFVEFAPLDAPFYHYPVSCATDAQARAIKAAFYRSEVLRNPTDARQVVFTVLPGHGVVIVEKWAAGKAPFQVMWEYMDAGYLQVDNHVPQGLVEYVPNTRDPHRRVLNAGL